MNRNRTAVAAGAVREAREHYRAGRLREAERAAGRALRAEPDNPDGLLLLGAVAARLGRGEDALRLFRRAVAVRPGSAAAHHNLGRVLAQRGELREAVQLYRRAIALDGALVEAHNNLGIALRELGETDEAFACYRRALALDPGHAAAHNNLGNALRDRGALDEAIASYRRALAARPDYPRALVNLGVALAERGDLEGAVASHRRALALDPTDAVAHGHLGNALAERGELEEAIACYRRALAIRPDYAVAHSNLGRALRRQGRLAEAIRCYRRAVAADPSFALAYGNLGNALREAGELAEAEAAARRAVALAPGDARAHSGLGNVLLDLGRPDEAIACYRRALALDAAPVEAHANLGIALQERGRFDEAIAAFRRALAIEPEHEQAAVALFLVTQQLSLWADRGEQAARLDRLTAAAIERGTGRPFEPPFLNIARRADPAANLAVARTWSRDIARRMAGLRVALPPPGGRSRGVHRGKIRLGYLSGNFGDHPVGHHALGLLARHDRDAFEVFAYAYGRDDGSPYRARARAAADRFVDLDPLPPAEAARRIREDGVDILIDLTGHTRGSRLEICAPRPAPVQATWFGFPGTSGADFIDYLVTDRIVTPPEHARFCSEAVVYLPHCWQINDYPPPELAPTATGAAGGLRRADEGLPDDAVVFGSLNQALKIEPVVFDAWMRILRRVPGSVLWLYRNPAAAEPNLRREAEARGVAAERLVFAGRVPYEANLARLPLADVGLDTQLYNGGITTSNALWAGVPVVTLEGGHFASRMGASILTAAGLAELVTRSMDEYESLAVALAEDRGRREALRRRLVEEARRTAPLFDAARFVRDLERAYREMWRIHAEGGRPRPIDVAALPLPPPPNAAEPGGRR